MLLRAEIILTERGTPSRVVGVLLDITEQKQAAERQQLLMRELDHHVKNMLATVQSVVGQTLRNAADIDTARHQIHDRPASLARAHDLLRADRGRGASIVGILKETFSPFDAYHERIRMSGPGVLLDPLPAVNLALISHELITNALKYGALSSDSGVVACDGHPRRNTCSLVSALLGKSREGGPWLPLVPLDSACVLSRDSWQNLVANP